MESKSNMEIGNFNKINENHPERGGWVIGSFIEGSNLRHSAVCEIKYAHYPEGFKKQSRAKMEKGERTLVVIISGKWQLNFSSGERVILSEEGDYVIFGEEKHQSEALETSHVMAIRWKEI